MSAREPRPEGLTATGRVPVEHRFFGLDRRSLLPGLVVIGLFVLWTVVVPAVNGLLSYDQTTKAGDVFLLGRGLTMDAQAGWGVESGLLTSQRTRGQSRGEDVALVDGGVSFAVSPGAYRGDLRTLLSQIDKVTSATQGDEAFHVAGDVTAFRTDDGARGLAQPYTTIDGEGVVAALRFGDTGLRITAAGPEAALSAKSDEIERMIDSIRYDPRAAG